MIAAKTAEPHPKLPGTIFTAADEVEKLGGKALPLKVDIRDEENINYAVNAAVKEFGGIDILVNNASAIQLTGTAKTTSKIMDKSNKNNVEKRIYLGDFFIVAPNTSRPGRSF